MNSPSAPPNPPQPPIREQASRSLRGEDAPRRQKRTPDQIARKRDQDREAQRVSRERTRRRIDEAETRIERLEATAKTQDRHLKHVIGERDAALTKVRELEQQLRDALNQLSFSHYDASPPSSVDPTIALKIDSGMGHGLHPFGGVNNASSLQTDSRSSSKVSWKADLPSPQGSINRRTGLTVIQLGSPNISCNKEHSNSPSTSISSSHRHILPQRCATAPMADRGTAQPTDLDLSGYREISPVTEPWLRQVCSSPPTSPFESVITLFLKSVKEALARGEPPELVMGTMSLSGLHCLKLIPSLSELGIDPRSTRIQPISQMLTDILGTDGVFRGVAEQVALFWLLHIQLQWQIHPTKENWDVIPEWARPLPVQCEIPHPVWMDTIVFPALRDVLTRQNAQFDEFSFSLPYVQSVSPNWPHGETDIVTRRADSGEMVVHPRFERHIRNIDNWTLGPIFARAFPHLESTYRHGAV